MKIDWLLDKLSLLQLGQPTTEFLAVGIMLLVILLIAAFATIIFRISILRFFLAWIKRNQYNWADPLINNRLLNKISWFVPIIVFGLTLETVQLPETVYLLARKLLMVSFVIVTILSLLTMFSTINDIHRVLRKHKGSTLRGYTDACKIITIIFGAIFVISVLTGKSPWGILSILGGLTAVTMLIFKDTILGFVASVQLTSTDMVRLGDWIEMEKFGADGDVIDITIHTIRVQNWDKTITAIPTYSLVTSPFKNWRGMSESGGRRIKRALYIDVDSIRFVSGEMLEQLSQIELIAPYLEAKDQEIGQHNRETKASDHILNGRCQTNIGIFRAYIIAYLKQHPKVAQHMTFLVRQLQPTSQGLPLEIYVFANDQAWANYEAIQADIFDHLLAAAPEFSLRLFQHPTGWDFGRTVGP